MKRALGNAALVLAIILIPFLLGALIVGGKAPVGRNSRSTTRVGHKAFYLVLEELGFRVRRFERGLETLPSERAVLLAVEPGPALFRERGRFAGGLLSWLADGNAALVTLGPDPDWSAELDDGTGELGTRAQQAIQLAEDLRDRARRRSAREEKAADRTKEQPSEPDVGTEDLDPNESWGSIHLLSLVDLEALGEARLDADLDTPAALTGTLARALEGTAGLALTRPRVFTELRPPKRPYQTLASAGGQPLLIELSIGEGRLLLLSEPRMLQNVALGRAAHARLAVRAVERLAAHAGTDRILFEEFSHGGREASTVVDVAFTTRARWVTLQLLLAILVWLLLATRRSRSVVPFEVPPRRSKDEVIDAMASLFLRANDTPGAARRLIELTRRRVQSSLPPGAEVHLPSIVASRTGRPREEIEQLLDPGTVSNARALVQRAAQLRELRSALDR